jgi:ankyrin repeat protein
MDNINLVVYRDFPHLLEVLLSRTPAPTKKTLLSTVHRNRYTPLMTACVRGNYALASILLRHGADPNLVHRNTMLPSLPLHIATAMGCQRLVHLLLRYGADPFAVDERLRRRGCKRGWTALDWAKHAHNMNGRRSYTAALLRFFEDLHQARDRFLSIRADLHKELMETLYHPDRLRRLGYFDIHDS